MGEELNRNENGPTSYDIFDKSSFYSYVQTKYTDLASFNFPDQHNWLELTLQQRRFKDKCPRRDDCSDCCLGPVPLPDFTVAG